jgi:hypothetical protein
MPAPRRLNTDEDKRALRALFLLYEHYKKLSWDAMDKPRDISVKVNAVYRNKLVPKIKLLVDSLNVGPNSGRTTKLKYDPLPFSDLMSIQDIIMESGKHRDYFEAVLGRVQSGTKNLLEKHHAADGESQDDAQEIIAEIERLLATQDSSIRTVRLGEKPKLELVDRCWYISGSKGRKKLCKEGSLNGELLNVLLKSWGAYRSYEAIFADVNAKTSKKNWDQACLKNAIKAINLKVSKAGYRRLKLTSQGTTVTIGYTDAAT